MQSVAKSSEHRDVPLEALRGMAALSVMAWHFLLGFDPAWLNDPHNIWRTTPVFAFFHGSAAIGIFFVLSGYVLTRRFFETGQKRMLVIGALKRWFRLFVPVFLSVMLSWFFFHFNLYAYQDAAQYTQSGWLYSFCLGMNPPFEPSFWNAVEGGFAELFRHKDNSFNPLLWTLHIELLGSYLVFALAGFIVAFRNQPFAIGLMFLLVIFSIHFIEPFLVPFLPGVLLSFYAPKLKNMRMRTALILLMLGILFLGYRDPIGFYSPLGFLAPINGEPLRAYTCAIGGALVMATFIGCEPLRKKFQGSAARALGRLSFPLYLVHMILLCSVASAVFVWAQGKYDHAMALGIAAAAWIPASFILAAFFAMIDIRWIAFVNKIFRSIKIADGRSRITVMQNSPDSGNAGRHRH